MSSPYNFKLPEDEADASIHLKETACPICGKIFFPTQEYGLGRSEARLNVDRYAATDVCGSGKNVKKPTPDWTIRTVIKQKDPLQR